MADQTTQLSQAFSGLRADVDALLESVPAPTESFAPEDRAVSCGVGSDDGSTQWVYSPGFRYAGPGAAVVEPAAAELERRGYTVGRRSTSAEESSFTAVKEGAAITVRDGPLPDEPGSAVVFLGYGPCVGTDGTVDTRNPQ